MQAPFPSKSVFPRTASPPAIAAAPPPGAFAAGPLARTAGVTPTIERRNATTFSACVDVRNACDGIEVPAMPSRMIFATSSSDVARRNCLNNSTPVTPAPVSL